MTLDRADHIAEWVKLTADKVSQLATPAGGRQPREEGVLRQLDAKPQGGRPVTESC